jgi:UDP:flavonoid glycosyltransferase YjiC (YdhE family)
VVAIPLVDDQPLVAYRIADELGLGIRLDFTKMNSNDIRKAVHTILQDKSYYERMDMHSKLTRKHAGHLNGAKLVLEYLTNNC